MVTIGKKAPVFSLPDQNGEKVSLGSFTGKWLVLYFYPKDSTPGCTIEAVSFTKSLGDLTKRNAAVAGISADSCESHAKFAEKSKLGITLLSDEKKSVIKKYGVWQEKNNYGKKYMGIVRTTFLINPAGTVVKVWEKVKVDGHAEDVLRTIDGMSGGY
ncbi:MAG: thioredoxin-dependent thiol peroxidase [Spirochaetes bacterium]|nr:thioredoxin-dependent thiol peroxidase [Spirochaetota bacterium]